MELPNDNDEPASRRIALVMSIVLLGVGLLMIVGGYRLRLQGQYGPGPGFTAFWVGVPLTLLSAVWLVRLWRRPASAAADAGSAEPGRLHRIGIVLGALTAFGALLIPLGFDLSMLALLLVLFFAFDREHPLLKLVLAFACSFGVHYVFERFLRLPLPRSSIAWLQALGL